MDTDSQQSGLTQHLLHDTDFHTPVFGSSFFRLVVCNRLVGTKSLHQYPAFFNAVFGEVITHHLCSFL